MVWRHHAQTDINVHTYVVGTLSSAIGGRGLIRQETKRWQQVGLTTPARAALATEIAVFAPQISVN